MKSGMGVYLSLLRSTPFLLCLALFVPGASFVSPATVLQYARTPAIG